LFLQVQIKGIIIIIIIISEFVDDGSLLTEFAMMWELRELFPVHFIVIKQTTCHLSHEANVKQVLAKMATP
jgi:hypothetical protein